MRPLMIEQLIQQILAVLKHLRCPGECHGMLCFALEWAQVGPGMGFPLLNEPSLSVPHHECAWWQSNNQKPRDWKNGHSKRTAHLSSGFVLSRCIAYYFFQMRYGPPNEPTVSDCSIVTGCNPSAPEWQAWALTLKAAHPWYTSIAERKSATLLMV